MMKKSIYFETEKNELIEMKKSIYFETEKTELIEMYDDYIFLKYYKREVLCDIKKLLVNDDNAQEIYKKSFNPVQLSIYINILKKYYKNIFNFEWGIWYESYLEKAFEIGYIIDIMSDSFYIDYTMRYLKCVLIYNYKNNNY